MKGWIVERGESGGGSVLHTGRPRFAARWTTGGDPDELAALDGPCWSEEGGGEEDAIHIHGFEWRDPPPGQRAFERLMERAARAIDEAIAEGF